MSFAVFGPGVLIVTRTDTPTPIPANIGYCNELQLDMSGTTKQLYGQNQLPIVAARGTIKLTGKLKAAVVSGIALNAAFFGSTFAVGKNNYYFNEAQTVLSSTKVVNNVTGGITDLGVYYASTGLPLQRVAPGSEATGKYSVASSTGTYTFAVADQVALLFNYSNFAAGGGGQQLQVVNQLIGSAPTFQMDYYTNLNQPTSKPFSVRLFACVSSKLSFGFKLEDFMMPNLDFDIFANPAGQVMNIDFPEIS